MVSRRHATMFGRNTSQTASEADLEAWKLTLNEMAFNEKHYGSSENQTRSYLIKTKSLYLSIGWSRTELLKPTKVHLAVVVTQKKGRTSTPRNLAG